MKVSLCCSKIPAQFSTGISSLELGICPKCQEHTEFVDIVYKVCHEYGGDFITTSHKEARERFQEYKDDRCDGIRLYEGLATSDDTDEIEWDLLDYFDSEEEIIPLENYQ